MKVSTDQNVRDWPDDHVHHCIKISMTWIRSTCNEMERNEWCRFCLNSPGKVVATGWYWQTGALLEWPCQVDQAGPAPCWHQHQSSDLSMPSRVATNFFEDFRGTFCKEFILGRESILIVDYTRPGTCINRRLHLAWNLYQGLDLVSSGYTINVM